MIEPPEPTDKLGATANALVNGPEDETLDWDAVDWRACEESVRRLRQRIFTASKAGDLGRVRNLQKLMLRSRANTLVSVRRVTARNAGRMTAGVDGEVVLTPEAKIKLAERVHNPSEPFKALPVRRVYIPKAGNRTKRRPLGIPVIADRCHQARVLNALEPEWEARFEPRSYGFRPGRGCHDAIEAIFQVAKQNPRRLWVLDADLAGALVPSSYCQRVHGGGVEQGCFGLWGQYSQAFSASVADVEGLQLAALDTLQHGLAGDAEDSHRVDDRHVAGGRVLDEQRAELVVDADPPRGAGGVLLAGDEPGLQPAEDRGGGDPEFVGGLYAGMLR
jgi:N-terminal domain of reverse transcriptase/Reverse transcriptase (RNA-dependent DNA polymerase)